MIETLFLILQLLSAGFILYLCVAFITGAPFVPSSKHAVASMIALAKLHPKMTVIDLGSGDGRLLFEAAKQGALTQGIEINPYFVLFTRVKAFFSPYRGKITVLWKNLWKADFHQVDVIFVYLLPWRMEELAAKLQRELKPGTLVVSNSFIFPRWKIERKDASAHIYVFRIPQK